MVESKPYSMVIGCGEKGASWIKKQNSEQFVGLDIKQPKTADVPLIIGDVFHLPLKTSSIGQIRADFIVNGLVDREMAAPQICQNPDILDTSYFPDLVRRWFVESMKRSHDSVRRNIKEVSTLLKTVALREMWRVLANNGHLQILDFEYNTNWIKHYAPQIVNERFDFIEMRPLVITQEDFDRSESLGRVVKGSAYVQKVELIKKYPAIGTNLPLSGFAQKVFNRS